MVRRFLAISCKLNVDHIGASWDCVAQKRLKLRAAIAALAGPLSGKDRHAARSYEFFGRPM
jgi:hypothetical protein